ncbi:hypothetical protein ALC60_12412 [Trachymyrmex zeteki]|uniref:Uncharacterized protein n=1 Tax=Mycetomoellerius zeteki TaxID=64791 RepID=A0A151WL45_9HYME|nr:hypothetical protein ALC60_12412 [Trachymyrmex zeteki]
MLFDGTYEGHEKRDGDRREKSKSYSSINGIFDKILIGCLAKHTQYGVRELVERMVNDFPSFLKKNRLRISQESLNNLTKSFFPCPLTQTLYFHSSACCSCVTEGNSIPEATQTHDVKEPFVISGFTASFTEFH